MFPLKILEEKDIICKQIGVGGKLAFRVYAPWNHVIAKQALATQKWQTQYFSYDLLDMDNLLKKLHYIFDE